MARAVTTLLLLAAGIGVWLALRDDPRPVTPQSSSPPPASPQEAGPGPAASPAPPEPAASHPPPVAAGDDPEPLLDEAARPSRALVRATLEATLRERFPMHKLSPAEVDRLADATLDLREAQESLRALPVEPEWADARRALRARVVASTETYVELLDMTPSEFSAEAAPGAGVDAFDPEEALPEPEYLREPSR